MGAEVKPVCVVTWMEAVNLTVQRNRFSWLRPVGEIADRNPIHEAIVKSIQACSSVLLAPRNANKFSSAGSDRTQVAVAVRLGSVRQVLRGREQYAAQNVPLSGLALPICSDCDHPGWGWTENQSQYAMSR